MVIFIGDDDAAHESGTDKASTIDTRKGIIVGLRRNVGGYAKAIEKLPPSKILDSRPRGGQISPGIAEG